MRKSLYFVLFIFAVSAVFLSFSGCGKKQVDTKIKVALGGQQPSGIDPTNFSSADPINGCVFDNLVKFSVDGEIQPMLAVSWKYSNNDKDLEFKLREGVKFSDGKPFTAKDVVFSVNRNRKTNMAIEDQLRSGFIGVEAKDDLTVVFKFEKPNAQFLYQTCAMMYIVSEAQVKEVGEEAFAKNPVGTGQYKFVDYKIGQYIDLVANDLYWGEKPVIKEARILQSPDNNTRLNMLRAGEVQLITNVPWSMVAELKESGFNTTKVLGPHAQALSFGMVNPNSPWANLKVRQAINYCIDKDAIIEKLFHGIPEKLQWQHSSELGYNSSLKPAYPYDPKKAAQLMKEAGYEKGFEMPLVALTDVVGIKEIVDYLSNSLKQINITIKLTPMNFGPEYMAKSRDWHDDKKALICTLEEIGGPMNPDPCINLTNNFYGGKPRGIYHRPDLTKIIDQALVTVDREARGKLVQKAYEIIDADLPMVQILQTAIVYAGQKEFMFVPKTSMMNNAYSLIGSIELK